MNKIFFEPRKTRKKFFRSNKCPYSTFASITLLNRHKHSTIYHQIIRHQANNYETFDTIMFSVNLT